MAGSILVFIGVCAIVAIYMAIVHAFLKASEQEQVKQDYAGTNAQARETANVSVHTGSRAHRAQRLQANTPAHQP